METQHTPPPKQRRPKRSLNIERIPPLAWKYADLFRTRLLEKTPTLALHRVPWDITKPSGLRAQWAEEFRLLMERDKRPAEEVVETIRFLLTGDHLFVVQSPASLIEKYDRIREAIARAAKPAPPRPGQQADNRTAPKFTTWGGDS